MIITTRGSQISFPGSRAGPILLGWVVLGDIDRSASVIRLLLTAPTRSMLADALAQYLVWKQWRRWLLVVGSHPADQLYGDALRRAAKRFGARIVQEKVFEDSGGARRTDSGVVQIQRQMSTFTQG